MKTRKLIDQVSLDFEAYHEERRFDPTRPDRSKDYAKRAITRTAKALLTGECADLDKLLGVVERVDTRKIGGQLWIAFRPPETEPENEG